MKQAVMTAPGRIELRDVPLPEVAPDQVLVRVKRIGVCGSDIHVFHGKHPLTPYPGSRAMKPPALSSAPARRCAG